MKKNYTGVITRAYDFKVDFEELWAYSQKLADWNGCTSEYETASEYLMETQDREIIETFTDEEWENLVNDVAIDYENWLDKQSLDITALGE